MIQWHARFCDICAQAIQRGTPYRRGFVTPLIAGFFMGEWLPPGAAVPTFSVERDGWLRFDICLPCVGKSGPFARLTFDAVDLLN